MGTINYGTSDIITIGLQPFDYEQFEIENPETGLIETDFTDRAIAMDLIKEDIDFIREKYNFYYYHVAVEWGYYEGFYIDIERNYPVCFDDYSDKVAAQKELTQIKAFLTECLENYCCVVYPGWCTKYLNYDNSISELKTAIKEERQFIKNTPTWLQYEKEGV